MTTQQKQNEWFEQWSMLQDQERFLFEDWIAPLKLDDLRGKEVLECGCGGGQHTAFMEPYARLITAVDLNTADLARTRKQADSHTTYVEADIAAMDLKKRFDIVLSIGVVHHTDDPDHTVANMIRHLKPGGRLVLWVYSKEGNTLVEYGVEPLRKLFLKRLPRKVLYRLSQLITGLLMLPVYTIYTLPLTFLPFHDYFRNFRKLSFKRNVLNVFDKLNAPQVQFISRKRAERWLDPKQFEEIHISSYCGVSWRASGRLKEETQ